MGDDRKDIPGSGEIRREGRSESVPPPSPQGASYDTQTPPEPEGSTRSWWPMCLIVGLGGCGCLIVVLLALGVIGGVGWSIIDATESALPEPMVPEEDLLAEPGADAALAWAANRRPDWMATISNHSPDWGRVQLVMGPPGSGGTTWVEIAWDEDAGAYELVGEGPIAADETDFDGTPEIFRPGEEVAKEAALGYVEEPDWVARVDSHSDDWRRVTVSVGPPESEFIWVMTLEWNDALDVYDLTSIDDVDYPGME